MEYSEVSDDCICSVETIVSVKQRLFQKLKTTQSLDTF